MPAPSRRLALLLAAAPLITAGPARAQVPSIRLFRVVGPRDEVVIGMTEAELARLGEGPEVARLARALVAQGQLTAWQYAVGRAPDGGTRYAATHRIAVLRNDALRIEPLAAVLPVAPPPAE
ncbi:MAG TPA: hypothetical protein VE684_05490 [Crenalkalicoccus sp.]|nr:hypothetical protein [Crenalkalicoccus sp.]